MVNREIGKLLRPDIDAVTARWEAYWAGEGERPLVWAPCPKDEPGIDERIAALTPHYPQRTDADFTKYAKDVLELTTECYDYVADDVPVFNPSFGPDQFAAFLGGELEYSNSSEGTSWSAPLGKELEDILPLRLHNDNTALVAMDKYMAELARIGQGRFVIGSLDTHSNLDALVALRGPENACFDIIEKPELVSEAMTQINNVFTQGYNRHYRIAEMRKTGTSSWLTAYSPKRFQTVQCDYICLLSPELSRQFVIPALEKELDQLDHAIYHLDGPGTFPHLDDILGLEKLNGVQWVPGAGNGDHGPAWFGLYKRILAAGKSLWIWGDIEMCRTIHTELRDPRVIYVTSGSRKEVEEFVRWLER